MAQFGTNESKRKSFSKPKKGSKVNSTLKVARKKMKLFLSRIDPTVSEKEITDYVISNSKYETKCIKLKAKYNSYGSFCIIADSEAFSTLNEPEFWPLGSLILPFRGKLENFEDNINQIN